MQSKRDLSERDIITKYIIPSLQDAGWDIHTQIREEYYFTDGRIYVRGSLHKRGKRKYGDIVLFYKPNIPVAIIEVKENNHSPRKGLQQAIDYAEILDIPSVYSTNGDSYIQYDRSDTQEELEEQIPLKKFPSPIELWKRYCLYKGIEGEEMERIAAQEYYIDTKKTPRYYQQIAINRTIEAVAKGQKRVLLTMATGTGKTYTAFNIIWRLLKSKAVRRVLFLADRNALIDQTYIKDFKPFGDNMTKIVRKEISKSYEVYLAIYQGLMNYENIAASPFLQFSKDFFDFIVIDECHRGSAKEDSIWRKILEHFDQAVHLGLTATPKETKEVSNYDYFGDPIYTYTLKQGIEDGYLAPYKVMRIGLNVDLEGWRPKQGKKDIEGNEVEDREYNIKDYDRSLIINERTRSVARMVSEYLKKTDRMSKTIIFCEDIDHAQRMWGALANENRDMMKKNRKYVMQITGDEAEGKRELSNFQSPKSPYPVIATTSELMTTGVDCQTCKVIVLDCNINSMTKFKQIIGRGTRINEDFGKLFFTIIDFREATKLFSDPKFDGYPEKVKEITEGEPIEIDDDEESHQEDETHVKENHVPYEAKGGGTITADKRRKVTVDGVPVIVLNERVQYYGNDGKLITESFKDYTRKTLRKSYQSLHNFLRKWNSSERKTAIIEALEKEGVFIENLQAEVGKEYDAFDLVCHVVFDKPPLTRQERAKQVKKRDYFTKYNAAAQQVLSTLLDKYADAGVSDIESSQVLKLHPMTELGTPREIFNLFGGAKAYKQAVLELKNEIYKIA